MPGTIDRTELQRLRSVRGRLCLSLFMPTHRTGPESEREDSIRFRNALRRAQEDVEALPASTREWQALEQRCREATADPDFWSRSSDGLVLYATRDDVTVRRLPYPLPEVAIVGGRFAIKPVLPYTSRNAGFLLLALSQRRFRLWRGTAEGLTEIEVPGMPADRDQALWAEDPENTLQSHAGGPAAAGRPQAVFHGQGGAPEHHDDLVLRSFQAVDRAVCRAVNGGTEPLVLAGIRDHLPLYRRANHYPGLFTEDLVAGNPDHTSPEELHAAALRLLDGRLDGPRQRDLGRYRSLAGTGRTSQRLEELLPAATAGGIETLFVTSDRFTWGRVRDDGTAAVHGERRPGDTDLLDEITVRTLGTGGTVHARPARDGGAPGPEGIAALLRF